MVLDTWAAGRGHAVGGLATVLSLTEPELCQPPSQSQHLHSAMLAPAARRSDGSVVMP